MSVCDSGVYVGCFAGLVRAEDRVRELLRMNPVLRSNDNLLCFAYWQRFDGLNAISYFDSEILGGLTSAETITRVRRKIQNDDGLYNPDEEISEARSIRSSAVKDWSVQK